MNKPKRWFMSVGGGHTIEPTMRYYPDLERSMVVMENVNGYQAEMIAEGLVNVWKNEK